MVYAVVYSVNGGPVDHFSHYERWRSRCWRWKWREYYKLFAESVGLSLRLMSENDLRRHQRGSSVSGPHRMRGFMQSGVICVRSGSRALQKTAEPQLGWFGRRVFFTFNWWCLTSGKNRPTSVSNLPTKNFTSRSSFYNLICSNFWTLTLINYYLPQTHKLRY